MSVIDGITGCYIDSGGQAVPQGDGFFWVEVEVTVRAFIAEALDGNTLPSRRGVGGDLDGELAAIEADELAATEVAVAKVGYGFNRLDGNGRHDGSFQAAMRSSGLMPSAK